MKEILKYTYFRISSTHSVCRKREPTFPRSRILQGRWESEMEWVREAIYDLIGWNLPKVNSYLRIWPLKRKRKNCVRRTTVCIIKCFECLHTNSLLGPYFMYGLKNHLLWRNRIKFPTPAPSHFPFAHVPLYWTRKAVPLLLADFDFLSIWKEQY